MRQTTVGTSEDGAAQRLVWSAFFILLVFLAWQTATVASRVPLAEDWFAVAPLTGQHPDIARWLWEQNNEHRTPLARAVLLVALYAAGGDFRAGQWLNLLLLAGTAAGLIVFARHQRGHTDPADAVFPLVLLNFGHSHQVLFAWQINFVLANLLPILIGCALVSRQSLASPGAARAAGIALPLLPLVGLNGILFVPPLAAFLAYAGFASWSGARGWPVSRTRGAWLLCSAGTAVALSALYFVGYQHPWWNPPSPGVIASFKTALKVLSFAVGASAQFWWAPAVLATVALFSATAWKMLSVVRQRSGAQRDYALGAAVFLATTLGFAWVIGWARAGYVPDFGIPLRYVLPVVPAVVASYLTWGAFDRRPSGRRVQRAIAVAMVILLPFNTAAGHRFFADWYAEGMARIEADLAAGTPVEVLARRYQKFLVHWWTPEELERHMRLLEQAGMPPFDPEARAATGR